MPGESVLTDERLVTARLISVRLLGGVLSPSLFGPQPNTVPSDLSARLWPLLPAATAIIFDALDGTVAGTLSSPSKFEPQAITVPSAFTARLWLVPAAIPTELAALAGMLIWSY